MQSQQMIEDKGYLVTLEEIFDEEKASICPSDPDVQLTFQQLTQKLHKTKSYIQLSENAVSTFQQDKQNSEKIGVFSFPEIFNKFKSKPAAIKCRGENIQRERIYYRCHTCIKIEEIQLCEFCFKPEEHKGHRYIDYKDSEKKCGFGWLYKEESVEEPEWRNSEQANKLIKEKGQEYLDCLKLYLLMREVGSRKLASDYFTTFMNFLEKGIATYQIFSEIVIQIWRQKQTNQYENKMLKLPKNQNRQFQRIFHHTIHSPSFFQTIYRVLFSHEIYDYQMPSNIIYSLPKIKALASIAEDQSFLVPEKYQKRYIQQNYEAIARTKDISQSSNRREWVKQIFTRFVSMNVFLNGSKYLQRKTKDTLHILAVEGFQELFMKLARKKIDEAILSESFLTEINFLFKQILILTKMNPQNIPNLFKKYEFTQKQIQKITTLYLQKILAINSKHLNLFTLKSLIFLTKDYQIEDRITNFWKQMREMWKSWDFFGKKLLSLVFRILRREYTYQTSLYQIINFENLECQMPELEKKLKQEQSIKWIHSMLAIKKTMALSELAHYTKYTDADLLNGFLDQYCTYSPESGQIIYVAPERFIYNPDFLLKQLLSLPYTAEEINIEQFLPYSLKGSDSSFAQKMMKIFSSRQHNARRQYLQPLFKNAFAGQNISYEKQLETNELFEEVRYMNILNWILCGKDTDIKRYVQKLQDLALKQKNNFLMLQFFGIKKKQEKKEIQMIESNPENSPSKEESFAMSEKARKMQKLKDKFKKKATVIRKNIIENSDKKQDLDDHDHEKICIICRESGKQKPLFFIGKKNERININLLLQENEKISIISSCFHTIHELCFKNSLKKNKNQCPLCKVECSFLLKDQIEEKKHGGSIFSEGYLKENLNNFLQSQIFFHGIGLFQPQKQVHHETFQFNYFPRLIFEAFDNDQVYQSYLEEIYSKYKQENKNIENRALQAIKSITLELMYRYMKHETVFTEEDESVLSKQLKDFWDQFYMYSESKTYILHILKVAPSLKFQFIQHEIARIPRKGMNIFFDFMLPQTMPQCYQWREKHSCGRLKAQYCLLCNKMICQFCSSISNHNSSVHNYNSLFLSLQSGTFYFYTKDSKRSKIGYQNRFGKEFGSWDYDLKGFKLSGEKFTEFLYQWIYSTVPSKQKTKAVAEDNDW